MRRIAFHFRTTQLPRHLAVRPFSTASESQRQIELDYYVNVLDAVSDTINIHSNRKEARRSVAAAVDVAAHRAIFDQIASANQITPSNLSGWYRMSTTHVRRHKEGATILRHYYGNSLSKALQIIYPEHQWDVAQFDFKPQRYWLEKQNQRKFLDHLFTSVFKMSDMNDWYHISKSAICEAGGTGLNPTALDNLTARVDSASWFAGMGLMDHFGGSVWSALESAYPEHSWRPWLFKNAPKKIWSRVETQRSFLDWFAREVGHFDPRQPSAWRQVRASELCAAGGRDLLIRTYGSDIEKMLKTVYPEFESILDLQAPKGHD